VFWQSIAGLIAVKLTSASISQLLTAINDQGICILGVKYVDELTGIVTIYRHDYPLLCDLLKKRGEGCIITGRFGIYWALKSVCKRPVLLIGLLVVFVLATVLPNRVLFICVEGNKVIPDNLIIEKAESCGMRFGASRALVRSEQMKNKLLSAIPELQWTGINTYGCVAVISVQERQADNGDKQQDSNVCGIYAARDGVIQEMTVYKGNPVCKPGQAVQKGELLVSGYIDCGILIQAVRADAEIYAKTQRKLDSVALLPASQRGKILHSTRNYSIIVGKKLINLYKGSGISDTGCVKIRTQAQVKLPGGFMIPVTFVEEHITCYETTDLVNTDTINHSRLQCLAEDYLQSHMVAGRILNPKVQFHAGSDFLQFNGIYECLEMIGKVQREEIIGKHGENG